MIVFGQKYDAISYVVSKASTTRTGYTSPRNITILQNHVLSESISVAQLMLVLLRRGCFLYYYDVIKHLVIVNLYEM